MSEQNGLTLEEKATNFETMRHIERVRNLLNLFARLLLERGEKHDQSKLERPEVEGFAEFTPKLAESTYGSPEYESFRKALGPALAHHYARNRHHPEHFPPVDDGEVARLEKLVAESHGACGKGSPITAYLEEQLAVARSSIGRMSAVDVVELLCDWKAASERHHSGNIRKSIAVNAERFGINPQLVRILENTAVEVFDA